MRFHSKVLVCLMLLGSFSYVAIGGQDIQVGLNGNEPTTAAVDPLSPNRIAVARGLNVAISTDFGVTFPTILAPGPNPPVFGTIATWGGCGDPSLAFDSQGRLFSTYLLCGNDAGGNRVDISVIVQQYDVPNGTTVGNPVIVSGTAAVNMDDKQWIAADGYLSSPFRDNLYMVWTRLTSGSQVMFSRSTDGGATWSAATQIDGGGEGFVWPSHIAVAPNGDLYITYHGDTCGGAGAPMYVLRDTQGGAQFQAGAGFQKTSFASAVTCNVQASNPADAIAGTDFWMQGAMQGFVVPDPLRPNNVYVIANDDPNDDFTTGDPGDIIVARSTDNGLTWNVQTVSHGPVGTLQVYPTGAVDQLGNLVVSWWDTRRGLTNAGGNFLLDQYATVSRDGGQSWTFDFRVSDFAMDPDLNAPCRFGPSGCGSNSAAPNTLRIGEYNGAAAANGAGYVIWTGNVGQNPPSGAQTSMFDVFTILGAFPDFAEPNDAFNPGVASVLGASGTYNAQDLTIHSDTDEDFFRVVAQYSGKLWMNIDYNSRYSDLDIEVRDKFNNVVSTSSGALDTNNFESIIIPAVAGEAYFVRVFAQAGQAPPINTYDVSIVNTPAPVPFSLMLAPGSDSGVSDSDNVTNVAYPTIRLAVDLNPLAGLSFSPDSGAATLADDAPGYKVEIYRNGTAVGRATPVAGQPGIFEYTFSTALTEGLNFITARVVIVDNSDAAGGGVSHAVGQGGESGALVVTLDTTAPGAGAIGEIDLLPASDSGGIDDDDITSFSTPSFAIEVNAPGFIRVYATNVATGTGAQVAQFYVTNPQIWQFAIEALNDGVYDITATLEDNAGNVGPFSDPLKVTIARYVLNLPGWTATAAAGDVTVDYAAMTIAGYGGVAGVSGLIGIEGIPDVNLDANGHALLVSMTGGDDTLTYTPSGADAGSVGVGGQMLNFSAVGGVFSVDALGGNDTVVTNGTAVNDTVATMVDVTTTVQVGAMKTLSIPTLAAEKIMILSLQGNDAVNIGINNTVSATLFVDGGEPTTVNKGNDSLNLLDVSPGSRGQYSNISGGSTPGSGAVLLTFKATGQATRVDYASIEKVTRK